MKIMSAHQVNNLTVREVERASIHDFIKSCREHLAGRVLDYGCGTGPYRRIIEEHGGRWIGYDDPKHPGSVVDRYVGDWPETEPIDAILCTQVIQYVPDPRWLLSHFGKFGATLVMTYPTHWPELRDDLWRFTMLGMERLLTEAGFKIILHRSRAECILGFAVDSERVSLGYGVVATRA